MNIINKDKVKEYFESCQSENDVKAVVIINHVLQLLDIKIDGVNPYKVKEEKHDDATLLNNPLSYPIQQMAGQKLSYECFVTKENYADNLLKIKRTLVNRIHHEFDFRNENNSIKLSEKVDFEVLSIKSDGYDFKVTAIIETVFI